MIKVRQTGSRKTNRKRVVMFIDSSAHLPTSLPPSLTSLTLLPECNLTVLQRNTKKTKKLGQKQLETERGDSTVHSLCLQIANGGKREETRTSVGVGGE